MKLLRNASIAILVLGATAVQAYGDCNCSAAKVKNGWCKDCKVGYFTGVKIKSADLFHALKGHTVEQDAIKCESCKKAYSSDSVCTHCKVGFAGKRSYHSWVAHRLSMGEGKSPSKMTCSTCKEAALEPGWCDPCKHGLVGYRAFSDKKAFAQAVEARAVLVSAASNKCPTCAIAMITDGKCAACKVEYKDGKKLEG